MDCHKEENGRNANCAPPNIVLMGMEVAAIVYNTIPESTTR